MNRLIHATSPYLLQHAHNPVEWYEWSDEALERAQREDRPILLSIGYAACHWCHVMAHESFEDPGTAAIMNEHFVCVKVDREERPDLDGIYMDAVQQMTGHGGWPMTVFLTPSGEPFYAGTYFPPEDRHGLPGFGRLLLAVAETWRTRRQEVEAQGRQVARAISRVASLAPSNDPLSEDVLRAAHAGMARGFDREWGGFGGAPKFPQPMTLEFLLRCHLRGYEGSLEMVTRTLDRMAAGGIYDHVGGGFHRYSTDARWHVPHFEKMLYDNALLARLYVRASLVTGDTDGTYTAAATETLGYLSRHLRHPGGGFYSSQDADSEGEEGRFYVWSYDELLDVLGDGGEAVVRYFGATPEGNWEGTNVLWTPRSSEDVAGEARMEPDELRASLARARAALEERRAQRVAPGIDDKVLAAWNGLAIAAYAEAYSVLGASDPGRWTHLADDAVAAAEFVLKNLRRPDGRLLRAWRDGRTSGPAYVDDHAFMIDGLLALYEATFDPRWIREARQLADDMIRLFSDPDRGGFFQTGADAESLVIRPKELFDNAIPSGNSVAADVLQRLAMLTGDAELERAGVSALRVVRDLMTRAPTMLGHALGALDLYLAPKREVAIAAGDDPAGAELLVAETRRRYRPHMVVAVSAADTADTEAIPLLRDRPPVDGRAAAYVCERFACQMPVTDAADLAAALDQVP